MCAIYRGVLLAACLLLLTLAGQPAGVGASGPPGTIATFAGGGTGGLGDNGPATAAKLFHPSDVALDGAGNLYIADTDNCRVRKVTGGTITTVAGNGVCNYGGLGDGGPATAAELVKPTGVAVDSLNNLYIADCPDERVRKVAVNGTITTFAGTGSQGDAGDGGPATAATFQCPTSVAVDHEDHVYIADQNNCWIREVTNGIITRFAGTTTSGVPFCGYSGDGGTATAARLQSPAGIAFDGADSLFIADENNCRVRQVTTGGTITTVAGPAVVVSAYCGYAGDGLQATDSSVRLHSPRGVALDAGRNLYIGDLSNNRVRKVAGGLPSGIITTFAGIGSGAFSGDGGPATSAQLSGPEGEVVDGAGNLYIADYLNSRVRIVYAASSSVGGVSEDPSLLADSSSAPSSRLVWSLYGAAVIAIVLLMVSALWLRSYTRRS